MDQKKNRFVWWNTPISILICLLTYLFLFQYVCYPWQDDSEVPESQKRQTCRKKSECGQDQTCYRHHDRRNINKGLCFDEVRQKKYTTLCTERTTLIASMLCLSFIWNSTSKMGARELQFARVNSAKTTTELQKMAWPHTCIFSPFAEVEMHSLTLWFNMKKCQIFMIRWKINQTNLDICEAGLGNKTICLLQWAKTV